MMIFLFILNKALNLEPKKFEIWRHYNLFGFLKTLLLF